MNTDQHGARAGRWSALRIGCWFFIFLLTVINVSADTLQAGISIEKGLVAAPQTGRLLIALSRKKDPEPRIHIGSTDPDAPFVIAEDIKDFMAGQTEVMSQAPDGDYFIQVLLRSNPDLRALGAPGNLYSDVLKIHIDAKKEARIKLVLNHQIPAEQLPAETPLVKYVKIQSRLLSDFYGRPMYLRAGIILPRDYDQQPGRRYPLWVRIGGWGARYTSVKSMMGEDSDFRKMWLADGTPQVILLQLDGAGPLGDCYQVNSANNGPCGDALVQELIPFVEKKFHAIGYPGARFLSGLSTGGWVSLALQVFYPDFFNGTWTFCPDPVDFRALELVNIYEDENAYLNKFGYERPSDRTITGDVRLTMRQELRAENVLGDGDNWNTSGGQWCTWNATYGPRGVDGRPVLLWDPKTGVINHAVAAQWKKYDLRLVLEQNWKTLGPKLQGKLHISVGDADNYFLNNAVHLLDEFLSHADPPYQGRIVYGPGKGHGWMDISTLQMMKEMEVASHPHGELAPVNPSSAPGQGRR